jgi:hypothetical protein
VGTALFFAFEPGANKAAERPRVAVMARDAAVPLREGSSDRSGEERLKVVATPETSPSVSAARPASRAAARGDRLGQEVALLSRATSALKAGRPADALKTLEAHRRRFPSGTLGEERRAATAQALCTLRRVREGRAALEQLARDSPVAARAKQVCDAAAQSSDGT